MTEDAKNRRDGASAPSTANMLAGPKCQALVERLFAESHASSWGLARPRFMATLERSARKRFPQGGVACQQLEEYLSALHLEDIALACACAEGCVAAWEHFIGSYRGYLRASAGAILRCSASSAEACELADSLFAELYGLADRKPGERSLFRYFHGRSTLKTWLRAVLAQRHVDAIRAGRRFESLEDGDSKSQALKTPQRISAQPADPHRERYAALFERALQAALAQLDARDEQRLRLYYAEEQTLAEIGRQLAEHESSVSRNLERIRGELRHSVEQILRRGYAAPNGSAAEPGLSEAQIALCFEYAAEDAPLDLEKTLRRRSASDPATGRQEP